MPAPSSAEVGAGKGNTVSDVSDCRKRKVNLTPKQLHNNSHHPYLGGHAVCGAIWESAPFGTSLRSPVTVKSGGRSTHVQCTFPRVNRNRSGSSGHVGCACRVHMLGAHSEVRSVTHQAAASGHVGCAFRVHMLRAHAEVCSVTHRAACTHRCSRRR